MKYNWIYWYNPATWYLRLELFHIYCWDAQEGTRCTPADTSGALTLSSNTTSGYGDASKDIRPLEFATLYADVDALESNAVGVSDLAARQQVIDQFELESLPEAALYVIIWTVAISMIFIFWATLRITTEIVRARVNINTDAKPEASERELVKWFKRQGTEVGGTAVVTEVSTDAPESAPKSTIKVSKTKRNADIALFITSWAPLMAVLGVVLSIIAPAYIYADRISTTEQTPVYSTLLTEACPSCINGLFNDTWITASGSILARRELQRLFLLDTYRKRGDIQFRKYQPMGYNITFEPNTMTLTSEGAAYIPKTLAEFDAFVPTFLEGVSVPLKPITDNTLDGDFMGKLLTTGMALFFRLDTVELSVTEAELPAANNVDIANTLLLKYGTTFDEARTAGLLYQTIPMPGGDDLPSNSLGRENALDMNVRGLLYRLPSGDLETIALRMSKISSEILTESIMSAECWTFARMYFRHSLTVHGVMKHVNTYHLTAGAFGIAAHSVLPTDHKLFISIEPFSELAAAILNFFTLTSPDDVLAMKDMDPIRLINVLSEFGKGYNWTFNSDFPLQLRTYGLDDGNIASLLVSIEEYEERQAASDIYWTGMVDLMYDTDESIMQDTYVQAWAYAICNPNGGNIPGVCAEGEYAVPSKAYLVDIISRWFNSIVIMHHLFHSLNAPHFWHMPTVPFTMLNSLGTIVGKDSVCTETDMVNALGNGENIQMQFKFFSSSFQPILRHVSLEKDYMLAADASGVLPGGYDAQIQANDLFNTYLNALQLSTETSNARHPFSMKSWDQVGNNVQT